MQKKRGCWTGAAAPSLPPTPLSEILYRAGRRADRVDPGNPEQELRPTAGCPHAAAARPLRRPESWACAVRRVPGVRVERACCNS